MSTFWFPAVGAALVFLVVIPALTMVAAWLAERMPARLEAQGSARAWWLVVLPSLGPLLWLGSSVLHQSEAGVRLESCIVEHVHAQGCADLLLFGAGLFVIVACASMRRVIREGRPAPEVSPEHPERVRMERLGAGLGLRARVRAVHGAKAPAAVHGWWCPSVNIDVQWSAELDDAELKACLLHEDAHVRAWDALALGLAELASSLNPTARWLRPQLARFAFARETQCDRHAVQRGAQPLALARSLVSAARPRAAQPALGGSGEASALAVRTQLLLAYAETPPGRIVEPRWHLGAGLGVLLGLLGPHVVGSGALDVLHHGAERAAAFLIGA